MFGAIRVFQKMLNWREEETGTKSACWCQDCELVIFSSFSSLSLSMDTMCPWLCPKNFFIHCLSGCKDSLVHISDILTSIEIPTLNHLFQVTVFTQVWLLPIVVLWYFGSWYFDSFNRGTLILSIVILILCFVVQDFGGLVQRRNNWPTWVLNDTQICGRRIIVRWS